ncbi:MAG: M6 family metalloprotease domain-containing protein [Gemmatimonadota bacterium]|nr:MAG: M6 family metalloprotease domain-containing protein [Gemmatimonadota bacterium]
MTYPESLTLRLSIAPGVFLLAGALFVPRTVAAQGDVEMLGRLRGGARPPQGYYETLRSDPTAFQFSQRNGWVVRGRRVAERRGEIRSRMMAGRSRLDARAQQGAAALVLMAPGNVVAGTLDLPVMLILFQNTDSASLVQNVSRSVVEQRLLGTGTAPPYTLHSYYRELSNDSLIVDGAVFEWTRVAQPDSFYEGNSNGLPPGGNIPQLITDIASLLDTSIDFGQFDNDGPDGVPNSGDDDGYVDAVVLIHPKVDGSCYVLNPEAETSIWAHRWSASSWPGGLAYVTDDASAGGGNILIDDYIIQGGQGGDSGCANDEPLPIGTVAHETGHLFGLPDLYDTGQQGAGIGRWGLMGSGNQQVPNRPVHMTAWTKAQLGWVTEILIDVDTTLDINATVTSDTSYILPIHDPADSTQYFILENRQRIGSDSMLIQEGLLVWHVDSVITRQRGLPYNTVNASDPYGVALEQADGRDDLMAGDNRGDTSDPFPGSDNNQLFGVCTTPASFGNNGRPSLVSVGNVTQLAPFGAVRVDIEFVDPDPIAIADTALPVGLMGSEYQHQLTATGGLECYRRWEIASGVLPLGIDMTSDGLIWGRVREQGDFTIEVRVESGSVGHDETFSLSVVAPALEIDSVVDELLELSTPLTDDERTYLDLQGNGNQQLDLGDFVQWIRTTAGLASTAEVVAVLEAAKERAAGEGRVP